MVTTSPVELHAFLSLRLLDTGAEYLFLRGKLLEHAIIFNRYYQSLASSPVRGTRPTFPCNWKSSAPVEMFELCVRGENFLNIK